MRRAVAGLALAIVVVIAGGVIAWHVRLHLIRSEIAAQAAVARTLIAAHAHADERMISALARPDLHVIIFRGADATVIDAFGTAIGTHPAAMPGLNPPGAGAGPRLRPRPPLVVLALQLAHMRPVNIIDGDTTITFVPFGPQLARFLAIDVGVASLCLILFGVIVVRRAALRAGSERSALLANLEERRHAAERYQRFLAETGHELRTPLTIVSGYVDILRSSEAAAAIDERVIEGMRAETARMRVLVEKMLTLARLNSPVSVPRLLDVGEAAGEIVATAQRRFPERTVRLRCDHSTSIVIDGDDLSAAVGNLIENAVKYAPGSPIDVRVSMNEGRATIAVSDSGPGIAPDERDAVFERFYRSRDRSGAEGLGLGLAIVKRVADRWNGEVTLASAPGATVFTLRFPPADEELHAESR